MTLEKEFKSFCKAITLDNYDDMKNTAEEIAKKLNSYYYGTEGDISSHIYIVGSVGRRTAIRGSSDLDILFVFQKIFIISTMAIKVTDNPHFCRM